jgi:Glycine zipper 2TM domain
MMRNVGAGVFAGGLLALAAVLPSQPAAAQDAVGGAIVGGALGGILGGALGHGRGAVAGAIAGATAGAVIASEAQPRPGGYFWWRGGCYYRYPGGAWSPPLRPDYCGY